MARHEDYATGLTDCAEVSQANCAGQFDGELTWWVTKVGAAERGEYDIADIAEEPSSRSKNRP